MSQANYTCHGAVAVITLDNPPVNGLGHALRSGIVEGVERANADPSVTAIVLIGAGKAFSGGADIREFNRAVGQLPIHQSKACTSLCQMGPVGRGTINSNTLLVGVLADSKGLHRLFR